MSSAPIPGCLWPGYCFPTETALASFILLYTVSPASLSRCMQQCPHPHSMVYRNIPRLKGTAASQSKSAVNQIPGFLCICLCLFFSPQEQFEDPSHTRAWQDRSSVKKYLPSIHEALGLISNTTSLEIILYECDSSTLKMEAYKFKITLVCIGSLKPMWATGDLDYLNK